MLKSILIFLTLFSATMSCMSQMRIAVLRLDAGVGLNNEQVDGLQDMLLSTIENTGLFFITERSRINDITKELGIKQASRLSTVQLRSLSRRLGVEAIIVGTANYQIRERTPIDVQTGMAKGEYDIDIRLVNLSNGHVIASAGDTQHTGETTRSLIKRIVSDLSNRYQTNIQTSTTLSSPITLQGYLMVHPKDLGIFSVSPYQTISTINKRAEFGFNDWRLPSSEELSIMNANKYSINLKSNATYGTDLSNFSSSSPKTVRLVRTVVFTQQEHIAEGSVRLSPKSYNFGNIPVLEGEAKVKIKILNESPETIYLESVNCSTNSITTSFTCHTISPGETGIITITLNTSGRQGMTIKREINIRYSDNNGSHTLKLPVLANII